MSQLQNTIAKEHPVSSTLWLLFVGRGIVEFYGFFKFVIIDEWIGMDNAQSVSAERL
jgi:hypothetical protein